ncbi:hypothetical protein RRF57_007008 [Xylaria bambusicola]|uniref:Uncharacterized protein n=1 Tax=Xylaria bambusicola TaxID=326684 RepID=A0AAN7V024_9PEZI
MMIRTMYDFAELSENPILVGSGTSDENDSLGEPLDLGELENFPNEDSPTAASDYALPEPNCTLAELDHNLSQLDHGLNRPIDLVWVSPKTGCNSSTDGDDEESDDSDDLDEDTKCDSDNDSNNGNGNDESLLAEKHNPFYRNQATRIQNKTKRKCERADDGNQYRSPSWGPVEKLPSPKREGPRDGISNHVTRTLKDGTIIKGKQGATFAGFTPPGRIREGPSGKQVPKPTVEGTGPPVSSQSSGGQPSSRWTDIAGYSTPFAPPGITSTTAPSRPTEKGTGTEDFGICYQKESLFAPRFLPQVATRPGSSSRKRNRSEYSITNTDKEPLSAPQGEDSNTNAQKESLFAPRLMPRTATAPSSSPKKRRSGDDPDTGAQKATAKKARTAELDVKRKPEQKKTKCSDFGEKR